MSALLDLLKKKKQDIQASSGTRLKTIKPAAGRGRYRILPSWRGEGQQFWHDFGQHFVKNAANEIIAIYMCSDKTYGKPCEVCTTISQGVKAATDEFTVNSLKGAKSTGRVLVNALHLDGPTPNEVAILELPQSLFGQIVDIGQEWEEAEESIFSMETGKDIMISREGTGLSTKYSAQVSARSLPVSPDVMTKLHNLDEYVRQESSEQLQRALNSVRSVAGLLPAPGASSGLPAGAAAMSSYEDEYATITPTKRTAAPAVVPVVEDVKPKPKPKAKVAAAPAAPVIPAGSLGDPELDDLLNELGA